MLKVLLFIAALLPLGCSSAASTGNPCKTLVGPKLVSSVGAQAPAGFFKTHPPGDVVLKVWVETDGRLTLQRVIKSSGKKYTDVAIETVRKWRYSPATCDGVATRFDLTLTLRLKDDE